MRVFLDTNVLASALGTRGLCADLFREVIASEDLVISNPLLTELRRILIHKFGVPASLADEMMAFLKEDTVHAEPGETQAIDINDKDDVIILSSALNGRAELFVTGDKEVLSLRRIGRMKILSPRDYWDRTRKRRKA